MPKTLGDAGGETIRVVVLEDEALYLDLLSMALSQYPAIEIVGTFEDGRTCLAAAPDLNPRVALLDIELPNGMSGIEVGLRLREQLPDLGIVLLSNHKDTAFISSLREGRVTGWSYLQKGTVRNVDALKRAIEGAASGFVVLDHQIVAEAEPDDGSLIARLTPRQLDILELIAEGYTNAGIAERLSVSVKTVENHINVLYETLQIDRNSLYQPRVLAVLEFLDQCRLRKTG